MLEQQEMGGSAPEEEQGRDLVGCWTAEGEGGKREYHVSKLLEEEKRDVVVSPLPLL